MQKLKELSNLATVRLNRFAQGNLNAFNSRQSNEGSQRRENY